MSRRLTSLTGAATIMVLIVALMPASTAFACGYHKPVMPPQCQPQPVPTLPPTPPPVATPAPTPVIPVTPAPTPVAQVIASQEASSQSGVRIEVCHFEPTTQQWEIRHSTQPGDRAVIEHNLCEQDRVPVPASVPIVIVVVQESAPEAPVSTPSIELVDVPVQPEIVPDEPVVTPEPTPEMDEPEPEPELPEQPSVPVQIP